jgi:hypothetical protein
MLTKTLNKDYIYMQLMQGFDVIKSFTDPSFVRHIEINNIDISAFILPKFNNEGNFIGGPTAFREEYKKNVQVSLQGITNPCLYIFELVSPDVKSVFETYKAFVENQGKIDNIGQRSCSSVNDTYITKENEPQILYVGKSEKPIDGRIVVHFGYYEKNVAGLQLVYWGKEIGLKVNVHVFELINKETHSYLEVLEKLLFIQLKPIIGKK